MMKCKNDRERMLCDISMVSFAVVDLTLYLDTHSCDSQAQDYFNHYVRLLNQMEREYAMKYGPLNLSTADSYSKEWKWAAMPMPWEGVN